MITLTSPAPVHDFFLRNERHPRRSSENPTPTRANGPFARTPLATCDFTRPTEHRRLADPTRSADPTRLTPKEVAA
ncbi:hypothetical protein GCM10029964_076610 [Kibdelosporangium lantanae]